ncbi:MAG: hypothetical protein QOE89_2407, partial [Pseudonocardiales bacterium]|nr:hypothetical protein [Pseudonocardiales bacterium]
SIKGYPADSGEGRWTVEAIGFLLIRYGETVSDRGRVLSEGGRSVWFMTTAVETEQESTLTTLRAAVDSLLDADLGRLSQDELLDALRGLESEARRIVAVQHRLVAEVAARDVAGELRYRDTASLLSATLLLTRGQATGRVNAAELLGPRTSVLGEPLPASLPATAQALTEGSISPAHTDVIRGLIRELPAPVRDEHQATAEALLAKHATGMDTAQLRQAATRILGFLHPDGTLTPDRVHRKDRDVSLHRHPDGSGDVTAHLTPACYALWETVLEPLARKRPDDGCGPDLRSPGQRRHDALEDAAKRLLRTGELPTTAGVATTLMITMTLDQLETRAGQATTQHGGSISINEALRLTSEGKALPVVLNDAGGILAYGRARRLASPGQRLALMARDRGCTFPRCRETAARSEVHHIVDWAKGGTTDTDQLALACGYHNNDAILQDWHAIMLDGIPHWVPPPHIDPHRKPQRNRVHRG